MGFSGAENRYAELDMRIPIVAIAALAGGQSGRFLEQ